MQVMDSGGKKNQELEREGEVCCMHIDVRVNIINGKINRKIQMDR